MTDKTLVIQHNDIINARYNMSSWEQRIVKLLISMIDQKDENFKFYRLSSRDIAEVFGVSHKDVYKDLRAAASRLTKRSLFIQVRPGREIELNWVASAEYIEDDGVVELEISAKLRPYLLQLKERFTKYEFGNLLNLKRQYSFRLFDLIKQYQYRKCCRFSVEEIRGLLDIGPEKYKLYKDFKKYALQPAVDEIIGNTDIIFDVTEKRKWKTVVEIEFSNIRSQRRKKNTLDDRKSEEQKTRSDIDDSWGIEQLLTLGVARKTAEQLFEEYDEEHIQAEIAYTLAQHKDGKLINPAGFVVEAIKNGYRDNQAEERARQEEATQAAKRREEHAKAWDRLKDAYQQAKKAAFDSWYASLSEDEAQELRQEHMKTVAPMLRNRGSILEKMFLGYLLGHFSFPSLQEWAQQNQVDVSEFEEELRREQGQAAA